MKLVLTQAEVALAVGEYLEKRGMTGKGVVKMEFQYEGSYDERQAVGVEFFVELNEENAAPVKEKIAQNNPKFGSLKYLQMKYREQVEFMRERGFSLEGYIARYGDPGVDCADGAPMYGDGGTAIYKADLNVLREYEQKIEQKTGMPISVAMTIPPVPSS